MKKLLLIAGVILILGGCTAAPDQAQQNQQPDTGDQVIDLDNGSIQANINKAVDTANFKYLIYKQWALPAEGEVMFIDYETTDCLGLANGVTMGGDLLSTIIADEDWREKYKDRLNVFSQDYVRDLEADIAAYTQYKADADFYAFYVCHLAEGIDLSAGYYWPTRTDFAWDYNLVEDETIKHLLLIDNGKVRELADVPVLDHTLTGGEVAPCQGKLTADQNIEWKCIVEPGFKLNEQKETTGIYRDYYLFNLQGTLLNTWQNIDEL